MPAGLTRLPQKSELIRSDICQSGPDSSRTTFLPAFANTEANNEPDAPAPTMTTSTFSRVAMSPPLRWFDVGHVGHTKRGISVDRAERRTVEIRVRRPDVENARLQQRFLGGIESC